MTRNEKSYLSAEVRGTIEINDPAVVGKIVVLAKQSGTTPKTWVETALADWILNHRSGRFDGDPARHEARETDRTAEYFD